MSVAASIMMPAAAMSDAEFILARRLANNWSSPELAQLLEQRPSFYAALSPAFPKLDKAVKVCIQGKCCRASQFT